MRTPQKRTTGLLAVLAAGALALTACTGGTAGGGGNGAEGGERVYVQAIADDPMGLNAQLISGATPSMFSAQILDPLIFLSQDYEMTPGLAESWELSDDGLDLTLVLREGVTWHDGEPFTAEDVAFNFEEIVPLQSFGAQIGERLESAEVVDEHTVVLHLTEPFGPLLETVASQFMVPKHLYEGTDYVTNQANMEPIGTGPMVFDSYSSGEQVTLTANPDYWGGEVQVDRAVYPIMTDPNARAEALFAGEVDQASVDVSQQDRVADDPTTLLLEDSNFPQLVTVMFNAQSEYLEDPAVRAAVFAALDREAIVDTALSGIGTPANGFFPEALEWAVSPDVDFSQDFPRDVDAINEALDEAGFERGADGMRFTLNVRYINELSDVAATVEMAQSMLEEVGIGIEMQGTSGAVFTEKVYTESDFDLAFLRSTVGADPSIGIVRWYECNDQKAAAANPSGLCDPEIDAAAAEALATSVQAERGVALTALQDRAAEMMYYAPLAWFNGAFPTINTTRWQGQDEPTPMTNRMPWTTMTMDG
ncbi:ABC transporter substrate-binding protein [Citricoccus sp.]|uniref:ABC transporter substrate-binding protein n=1 Tax=Citricoccus sp. TaxID=1978372 RepID=UPI0028BDB307|nr:ABC transporter substrate-binding protein [Citricoccus sp.]